MSKVLKGAANTVSNMNLRKRPLHESPSKLKSNANANKRSLQEPRAAFGEVTNRLNKAGKVSVSVGGKGTLKSSNNKSHADKKPVQKVKAKIIDVPTKLKVSIKQTASSTSTQDAKKNSAVQEPSSKTSEKRDPTEIMNARNAKITKELKARIPDGVPDYDGECMDDPFQVSEYVFEIFEYYRKRELKFPISKYLTAQTELNRNMRAILVDWMVEVQESFELNHETLYLAVKLVDLFLSRFSLVKRDKLQLIGATAMFLAAKYDERSPPVIDDFCYICDDAYSQKDVLSMEVQMLKTLGYDIGVPLSYRFLRRYARCAKLEMETLTLARYILEMSLADYDFIDTSDSLIASASLLLALKITGVENPWTPTLQYYSGYTKDDIFDLSHRLFNMIRNPQSSVKTITAKYSHKVFYAVAKTPLPDELKL